MKFQKNEIRKNNLMNKMTCKMNKKTCKRWIKVKEIEQE